MSALSLNKIYNEDCLEGMSERIPDSSVDMILADLPYGTTNCKWDSVIPLEPLWEQYKRIIKDDTAIVLTASQPFTTRLIQSNTDWFKYEWIWVKNRPTGMASAKYQPMRNHEEILVFCKTSTKYNPIKEERDLKDKSEHLKSGEYTRKGYGSEVYDMDNSKNKKLDGKRNPTTVKKFDVVSNHGDNRKHSSQKPVDLFKYLIATYTNKDDIVLDNVIGSGTTAVAAKALDRDFIGFEKNEEYVEIARDRIKEVQKELI